MAEASKKALDRAYEIYGPDVFFKFLVMVNSPGTEGLTEDEVLAKITRRPTPTTSYFFRDHSLQLIAETLAHEYVPADRPLAVRHVGGGPGHEAYSMAALLAGNELSFECTSIDVNPEVQPKTKNPTFVYHDDLRSYFVKPGDYERYVEPYFDIEETPLDGSSYEDAFLITPRDAITDHVDFRGHDILTGALNEPADITFVRNLLWHYPWRTRDTIVTNALGGMTRGLLAIEVKDMHEEIPGYFDWIDTLERFGLAPCAELASDSDTAYMQSRILRYEAA